MGSALRDKDAHDWGSALGTRNPLLAVNQMLQLEGAGPVGRIDIVGDRRTAGGNRGFQCFKHHVV